MATWEDGPEYAPYEPPGHFTAPEVAPLSHAEPRASQSAGAPVQPPGNFTAPQAAPLAAIGSGPQAGARNPQQPFAVHAGALTEGSSAWGAAHYASVNAEPAEQQWAPPSGSPTVATGPDPFAAAVPSQRNPTQPMTVGNAAAPAQDWPAPTGHPPGRSAADQAQLPLWRQVTDRITWPLIASLVLGLIIPISPVMLIVSTALAQRLDPSMRAVRIGISVGMGYVLLIALISLLGNDWWGTTSIWAFIVTLLAMVYAGAMGYLAVTKKSTPKPPSR